MPGLGGTEGILARFSYSSFEFQVVYAEIPESQPFAPRLFVERRGRSTDNVKYGFEIRTERRWTESTVLNERYTVKVSPFQDDIWLRRLFIPTFIDYLANQPPTDFSFELAYGSLLCSIEADDPDEGRLAALWDVSTAVARRIQEESRE